MTKVVCLNRERIASHNVVAVLIWDAVKTSKMYASKFYTQNWNSIEIALPSLWSHNVSQFFQYFYFNIVSFGWRKEGEIMLNGKKFKFKFKELFDLRQLKIKLFSILLLLFSPFSVAHSTLLVGACCMALVVNVREIFDWVWYRKCVSWQIFTLAFSFSHSYAHNIYSLSNLHNLRIYLRKCPNLSDKRREKKVSFVHFSFALLLGFFASAPLIISIFCSPLSLSPSSKTHSVLEQIIKKFYYSISTLHWHITAEWIKLTP